MCVTSTLNKMLKLTIYVAELTSVHAKLTSMLANICWSAHRRPSISVSGIGFAGSDEPTAEPNMLAG